MVWSWVENGDKTAALEGAPPVRRGTALKGPNRRTGAPARAGGPRCKRSLSGLTFVFLMFVMSLASEAAAQASGGVCNSVLEPR